MKIIFVRHGLAKDREEYSLKGLPDHTRPLTKKGQRQFQEVTQWLSCVEPHIDEIWTSPFTRAQQTAEILHQTYPQVLLCEKRELEPQSPISAIQDLLQAQAKKNINSCLTLVGHEPHLSRTITSLISPESIQLELKREE